MRSRVKKLVLVAVCITAMVLGCRCCSATYNQPLVNPASADVPWTPVFQDEQTLLYACFSGGGIRAMAMGYHVVEELAKIKYKPVVRGPGLVDTTTLRDEIDYTSGVSGGSFVSAALTVYPASQWPEFYQRAVSRNIQGTIIRKLFEVWNWPRLLSPYYTRTDMASEFYDRHIFQRKTFGQLPARPVLYINSTVLALGTHLVYNDEYFRYISSDITSYPLGFACAGSSAFPVGFAPMTLKNYAPYIAPDSLSKYPKYKYAKLNASTDRDARNFSRTYEFLKDTANRWLHVSDGGIAGNTGIERVLNDWRTNGTINKALNDPDRPLKRLIFVVVNAGTTKPDRSCVKRKSPGVTKVLLYTTTTAMDILSGERVTQLQDRADDLWQAVIGSAGKDPALTQLEKPYLIEITAQNLQDRKLEDDFNQIPTSFDLSDDQLNTIHQVVLELLANNSEFTRLKKSIAVNK